MTVLERSPVDGPVTLVVLHSPDASLVGREIELHPARPVVTIGRAHDANIVFPTPDVSRRHATITWADGRWTLRDEGSTHGVRLHGELVREAVLAQGDRVQLGATIFVVDPRMIVETVYTRTTIDGLTHLANRRHFLEELQAALDGPVAVVRLDVDDFKAINDTHGHLAGDDVLRELARRLRAAAPTGLLVARVGGDDFAILLVGSDAGEALRIAAHVRARVLAAAHRVGDAMVRPQLSAGVASAPHESAGVAATPRAPEGLLLAAEHDLRTRRRARTGSDASCTWAFGGVWAPQTERNLYAGAGVRGGVFVVSDGDGSHASGWLGARLAVRVLLERFAAPDDEADRAADRAADGEAGDRASLLGTADLIPDEWGWPEAQSAYPSGEALHDAVRAELGDVARIPPEMASVLAAVDRALDSKTMHDAGVRLLVGCTAARVVGRTVVGAHVGSGRARILRAGAASLDDSVVPHFLHRVAARSAKYADVDPSALPPQTRILVNGLGQLASAGIGVDTFETVLGIGDVLVLCSSDELGLADGQLVEVLSSGEPLLVQVREIERRLGELFATEKWPVRPSPSAFVVIRGR